MNEETRPDKIDFMQILMDEINEQNLNLNNKEKRLLTEKLFNLYEEGWYDTEANITIRDEICEFIQGFIYYKIRKDEIMEDSDEN